MPDDSVSLSALLAQRKVLADFGEFALRSGDLDAVLHEACRLVGEALGTGRAKVLEIEEGGQSLLVRAGVGWAPGVVGRVRVPMAETSSESYSIRAGEPVITQDIGTEDRFEVPPFMRAAGVVALANVPIFLPGRTAYGLLQVDDTVPRAFDRNDTEFLRTYANLLGPVIDRLLKLRELGELERRQRFLLGLGDALRAEPSAEGVADLALRRLAAELGLDRCYVGVYRLAEDRAEFPHQVGGDGMPPLPPAVRLSDFPEALRAALDGTLVIEDVERSGALADADRRNLSGLGFGALVAATLRRGGGSPFWSIVAVSAVPRRWTRGEIALVEDVAERTWAAMEQAKAEAALREAGRRQAFLLGFSDALRAEPDVDAVANRAIRMLSEQMDLDRCYITFYLPEDDEAVFPYQVGNGSVPPLPARLRLSDFPEAYEQVLHGTFVVHSDFARRDLPEAEQANRRALGLQAMLGSTIRRGEGNALASMMAVSARPRRWTPGEIALAEEVAERTWAAMERARAVATLAASEAKFRTLFESIDEGLAILEMVRDGRGEIVDVICRQVNGAFQRQSGIRDAVDRSILALLPGFEDHWLDHYRRVARTGVPVRVEAYQKDLARWFEVYFWRVDEDGRVVGTVFNDVTARKRAEAELRASEERKGLLLALGDAMRAQSGPAAVIEVAARRLGEHLGASRVLFAEFDHDRGVADIFNGWFADGAQPFPTTMRLKDYEGPVLDDLRAGRTVRVDDTADPALGRPDLAGIAGLGVRALLSVPLLVDRRLKVNLSIHQHDPRRWSDAEVALVQEVAERVWADLVRLRAEAALRASEERFRAIVESARDYAIFTTDPEGRIDTWPAGA